jgi:hypothetical protein
MKTLRNITIAAAIMAGAAVAFAQTTPGILNYFARTTSSVGADNALNVRGTMKVRLGGGLAGTADMNPVGSFATNITAVGNGADQTEDNLQTFSLAANALDANGKCVYIYAAGSTGANADSKDLKLYFGATVVAQILANTANAKSWYADAFVCRTSAGAQIASGSAQVDATASVATVTTPAETETGAIVIKVTGKENAANTANAVVSKLLVVQGSR